jgi:DNA polymerase III gamma/tau subunit
MAWAGQAVGAALGTIATIGGNLDKDKIRSQMLKVGAQDPTFTQSKEVGDEYGLAKMMMNARMPGAQQLEQNVSATGAAANANVDRSATDASQALAMKSLNQDNTNKGFQNLAQMENQNQQQNFQNLNQATGQLANQEMTKYEDQVRRWQDTMNILLKRGDIKGGEWQSVANLGSQFSSMNFGGGGK